MIVEDNASVLRMLVDLLKGEGFMVVAASDASEFYEAMSQWRPDIVVMDIQLPVVDGLELTKLIKSNPATRTIPVVALTSYAMKGDRERALAAGCDAYLAKPIDTRSFAVTLAGFIKSPTI